MRKILPVKKKPDFTPDINVPNIPLSPDMTKSISDLSLPDSNSPLPSATDTVPLMNDSEENENVEVVPLPDQEVASPIPLWRSTRTRVERKFFNAKMHGKTHDVP